MTDPVDLRAAAADAFGQLAADARKVLDANAPVRIDWGAVTSRVGAAMAPALAGSFISTMFSSAIREAAERQQAQAQGRTVTMDDVVAMARKLPPRVVVLLDGRAPTHKLLVMDPSELDDRRTIIMHPDTARACWRQAPLEALRLGIPDPDAAQ